MSKLKISGKELLEFGFEPGRVMGVALRIVSKEYKHSSIEDVKTILTGVLASPEAFVDHEVLGPIAQLLIPEVKEEPKEIPLNEKGAPYSVYGADGIEKEALVQMNLASKLPIAVAGALMPDAHAGYGLPIGGVLATKNAIIPFGVGVDIGCRMCLTIYDEKASYIDGNRGKLKNVLLENTFFGMGVENDDVREHEFLDRKEFNEIKNIKALKDKAWKQLGTSGGGNHFVDIGIVKITDPTNDFGLEVGEYIGVLSHSGSRGFGATLANKYTEIAMEKTPLPKEAKHLAWLDLNSEEGMEYWIAMNMAGDYAQACHDEIHRRIGKALKMKPVAKIENHHNFAWKEIIDGQELIVHRKGATPAGKGVLGIIPGSMVSPGFIVRGRGVVDSISSASHGAGRTMSRTKARNSFTQSSVTKMLDEHKVTLVGGGLDEAPLAYKDISKVMEAQGTLIDVLGSFTPQVVRMSEEDDF
ncbi:MAG: RtcB family protein [Nanoarchaeota archaeon]